MKRIVVLGAGTGGALLSNRLARKLGPKGWSVTVIDKSDLHLYQPGLLFLPFTLYGHHGPEDITKPIRWPLDKRVEFVRAEVNLIDHAARKVETTAGTYPYDYLILALGCGVDPARVEGLAETMGATAFTYYTLDGAMALQKFFNRFDKGRMILNIAEMPIKCPVAPIEFVFLADYYFRLRGIRDKVEVDLVTPLSGAFTKPLASAALEGVAREKDIRIIGNFDIASVDGGRRVMRSWGGREEPYDVLVTIPPHVAPEVIENSGLADLSGFADTDRASLKSRKAQNVYVVGDCSNIPTSKAGSVAHFSGEIVEHNLLAEIEGREPVMSFDGHSNCFIESGHHKALLFDFNYDTQPLPGLFPFGGVGPFPLLKESRINHWGKMAFRHVYWWLLTTGRLPEGPWAPALMSLRGKHVELLAHAR